MLNGLSLFSGIGGIDVALSEWVRPVAYCEIEPYCQSVLLSRMQTGDLPKAPIWDDISTLRPIQIPAEIDIIYGGFPCQDISVAGAGKGLEGERSGLFFEILRLAKEIKPKFLFLENVPAITSRGGLRVVREVAKMGYDCRWCVISAAGVGALHRRERWFLLAHSKYNGEPSRERRRGVESSVTQRKKHKQEKSVWETERTSSLPTYVANSESKGLERQWRSTLGEKTAQSESSMQGQDDSHANSFTREQANTQTLTKHSELEAWREYSGFYRPFESREHWQKTVSEMGKCSDGLPYQVDRLKSLGNAVVPQQVRRAWMILTNGS